MGDGGVCGLWTNVTRLIILAVSFYLAVAASTPAVAESVLASCDIANLPDSSLINRDGRLAVRASKAVAGNAYSIFTLAELPHCGAMIQVQRMSFEERARFIDDIPNVAASEIIGPRSSGGIG